MSDALLDYCLGKGPKGRGFKMPGPDGDSYRRESEERRRQERIDQAEAVRKEVFANLPIEFQQLLTEEENANQGTNRQDGDGVSDHRGTAQGIGKDK